MTDEPALPDYFVEFLKRRFTSETRFALTWEEWRAMERDEPERYAQIMAESRAMTLKVLDEIEQEFPNSAKWVARERGTYE
jgi:hypothetical protein